MSHLQIPSTTSGMKVVAEGSPDRGAERGWVQDAQQVQLSELLHPFQLRKVLQSPVKSHLCDTSEMSMLQDSEGFGWFVEKAAQIMSQKTIKIKDLFKSGLSHWALLSCELMGVLWKNST